MPRPALVGTALLLAGCAARPPVPLSLAVEAALDCAVAVVEAVGFREEYMREGSSPNTVVVRFVRAGDTLTLTVGDRGAGDVYVEYSFPSQRRHILQPVVNALRLRMENRCRIR